MILRLQVSSDSGRPREPVLFRDAGGTIGRSEQCTCILPDKFVSSFHAKVHYKDGAFLIEDTSQNGVFINSTANRLVRGQPHPLTSGDLILIDPYEISVTIEEAARSVAPPIVDDPFVNTDDDQVDPMVLLGGGQARKKRTGSRAEDLAIPSPVNVQYRPPDPILPDPVIPEDDDNLIPDDWDKTGFGQKSPQPTSATPARPIAAPVRPVDPTPARAPAPPERREPQREQSGASGELSEVLKGAGLSPDLVTPELAQDFGRIIRIIIQGLMDVLHARQELKGEFGMQMTVFRPSGNNPLKLSANVEDALHNLLVKRNAAYLGPVPAFEDAFSDVLHHQMAMLAGMRAAFEAMLKSFNPEKLQEEFDRHGKGLISMQAKAKYWDQYKARFGDIVADTERCFEELFGQEFARAYDEQLERLKAERRSPGRSRK